MRYTLKKFKLFYFLSHQAFKFGLGDVLYGLSHRQVGYEAMLWKELIPGECQTIIDVGAHVGSVSAALNFLYHPKLIIAIEPNPEIIPKLTKRFENDKNIEIVEQALTSTIGKTVFYAHEFEAASSVYRLQKDYLNNLGLAEGYKQLEVSSITLDEVISKRNLNSVDLLKLDCQGAELEILQGTEKSLQLIKIINTEVLFNPLYEGAPRFCDIHDFLTPRGFELRRLHSFSGPKTAIHWADAIYFNTSF